MALINDTVVDANFTEYSVLSEWPLPELEKSSAPTDENKPPRLNLTKIHDTRIHLRDTLKPRWLGVVVTPALIQDELLPEIAECLPRKVNAHDLHTTLSWHLDNVKLTKEVWDYLSIRLAGNLSTLKHGPLTASPSVDKEYWALLETTEAELHRSKSGTIGTIFQYRAKTGQAAGCMFRQFLPIGFLPTYGDNLGVGKARWWRQPRIFVGMNLLGYLSIARTPRQLYVIRIRATATCKQINKIYEKGRTDECIHGMHHSCWVCPRGLLEEDKNEQCIFATHLYAWLRRQCPRCGRLRWFYTHWQKDSPCVQCREGPLKKQMG